MTVTNSVFILASLLLLFPRVEAWGKIGHQIVANIAYNRLDQDKREKIDIILNFTDFETQGFDNQLAAVADWADTVRYVSEYHWTGILHYINLADNKIKNGCPCQNNNEYSHPTKFKFHSEPYCHNQTDNTSCNFVYERDCVDGKCVAGAIHDLSMMVHNTSNFKDQLTSNDEKEWSHEFLKTRHTNEIKKSSNIQDNYKNLTNKQRLMFIIHFMGDIHQPLHCSRKTDEGGNSIKVVFSKSDQIEDDTSNFKGMITPRGLRGSEQIGNAWNLHSVWDDGIIEKSIKIYHNDSQILFQNHVENLLTVETNIEQWSKCSNSLDEECPKKWAQESVKDALKWAYNNDNREVVSGDVLSEEYFETRLKVVERRLAVAGLRLATSLNVIFG